MNFVTVICILIAFSGTLHEVSCVTWPQVTFRDQLEKDRQKECSSFYISESILKHCGAVITSNLGLCFHYVINLDCVCQNNSIPRSSLDSFRENTSKSIDVKSPNCSEMASVFDKKDFDAVYSGCLLKCLSPTSVKCVIFKYLYIAKKECSYIKTMSVIDPHMDNKEGIAISGSNVSTRNDVLRSSVSMIPISNSRAPTSNTTKDPHPTKANNVPTTAPPLVKVNKKLTTKAPPIVTIQPITTNATPNNISATSVVSTTSTTTFTIVAKSEAAPVVTTPAVKNPLSPKTQDVEKTIEKVKQASSMHLPLSRGASLLIFVVIAIVVGGVIYVAYQNKRKIIAYLRASKKGDRPRGGQYKRVSTSVEDVVPSLKQSQPNREFIY